MSSSPYLPPLNHDTDEPLLRDDFDLASPSVTPPLSPNTTKTAHIQSHPWHRRHRYRRCRCCWCCKCSGCIMSRASYIALLLAVLTLGAIVTGVVFLYIIVPQLVTSAVSGSVLNFLQINITEPTSDDMRLVAVGVISNTGPFEAKIDSMVLRVSHVIPSGMEFALGSLTMPPLDISGPTTLTIDTRLQVSNLTSFNRFVRSMIFEETITWHMQATAAVTPTIAGITLPTYKDINFDKVISLGACAGLLDVRLDVFKLDRSNLTSVVIDMLVSIFNPSIFNIMPLGDLHFDIEYQGALLGPVRATNASLYAGFSAVSMTGVLTPSDLSIADSLVNRFLTVLDTNVTARAASDASSVALFNAGMSGLELATTLKGNTIPLLGSMTFVSMVLSPTSTERIVLSSNVTIVLDSPLGVHSPVIVLGVDMNVTLIYAGVAIGSLHAPYTPSYPVYAHPSDNITFTFACTISGYLDITGTSSAYSSFVVDFLNKDAVTLLVSGVANVNATYVLGPILIHGFPLNVTTSVAGMSGLTGTHVLGLQMPQDYSDEQCREAGLKSGCGVEATAQATVYNPSSTVVQLGSDATLALVYKNQSLGVVHAVVSYNPETGSADEGLSISPGLNYVNMSGLVSINANASEAAGELFSQYLQGISSMVELRGDMPLSVGVLGVVRDSGINSKSLTVNGLHLTTALVGPDAHLIKNITMTTLGLDMQDPLMPFATAATIVAFKLPDTFTFHVNITSVSVVANVDVDADGNGQYAVAATLENPPTTVVHVHAPAGSPLADDLFFTIRTSMSVSSISLFSIFASSLLLTPVATALFDCVAAPHAVASFGEVTMPNVKAKEILTLTGFNAFRDVATGAPLMKVLKIDITDGFNSGSEWGGGYAVMQVSLSLVNPSNVYLVNAGNLTFQLSYSGSIMAKGTLVNYGMALGENQYTMQGIWAPPVNAVNEALSREFLSAYLNGVDKTVTASGSIFLPDGTTTAGTDIPYLKPAISALSLSLVIPGLSRSTSFFQEFGMKLTLADYINILAGKNKTIPTQVTVFNPFSTDLFLTGGNLTVILGDPETGTVVGRWCEDRTSDPVLIARSGNSYTPLLPVSLDGLKIEVITAFLNAIFKGTTPITAVGPLRGVVGGTGGYETYVDIIAPNIPGKLI